MSKDDEISIDFSKIKQKVKGIFSNKDNNKVEETKNTDDVSIDFKAVGSTLFKYRVLLLLLIPLFLAIFMRAQTLYLPITDDWAQSSIENINKNIITQQINQQYPNLPNDKKAELAGEQWQQMKDKGEVLMPTQTGIQQVPLKDAIKMYSESIKQHFQDESGQTYLLELDPYFWLQHAENIIKHGYPGDTKINGVQYDMKMIAPLGRVDPTDMGHAYLSVFVYKIYSIIGNQPLKNIFFLMPLIICALATIPAFFIGRKIGGNIAGLIAAIIVAIHPFLLGRTPAGFSDTDSYNALFPLLITWIFIEAYYSENKIKTAILSAVGGLLTGIYGLFWSGWWYIFHFIITSTIITIIYQAILNKEHLKEIGKITRSHKIINALMISGIFIIFVFLGLMLIGRGEGLVQIIKSPLYFLTIHDVGTTNIWPNVFTTVAEQNEAHISEIISNIGGKFALLLSIIGIILILTPKILNKKEEHHTENIKQGDYLFLGISTAFYILLIYLGSNGSLDNISIFGIKPIMIFGALIILPAIIRIITLIIQKQEENVILPLILLIWLASTIIASTLGIRFVLLMVPAFAIGFGLFCGALYNLIQHYGKITLHMSGITTKILAILLVGLLLITPYNFVYASYSVAKMEIPLINDAWYNALDKINHEAADNAIINSWWDYGHWFKQVGNRSTTFDGASQGIAAAHWIGRVLLTDNEDEAMGILRMLDCGSNNAFEELDKQLNDPAKSVKIIKAIILLNNEDARKYLNEMKISNPEIVLKNTHCEYPENYFITSDDMIGKSGVWAHFGAWDFDKANKVSIIRNNNKDSAINKLKEYYGMTQEVADNLYSEIKSLKTEREVNDWISLWPSYASGQGNCKGTYPTIQCYNNIQGQQVEININLETETAYVKSNNQNINFASLSYINKDNEFVNKKINNSGIPLGISLIPTSKNTYQNVIMDPALTGSMFNKLYYYEGHGLLHFDIFTSEQSITGNQIYVYKVDWEGKNPNVMKMLQPKLTASIGDSVTVDYIGLLEDGELFDTSIIGWKDQNKTGKPTVTSETIFSDDYIYRGFEFTLGSGVIEGFSEGITGMKKGETKTLTIPPEKAYGTDPKAHPLGNKTLIFKIIVRDIQ